MKRNVAFHYKGDCSEKEDITSTLQLWFSCFHAPSPLLIHTQPHHLKKQAYLHRPAYIFQELYYAYKLDLDCVTNLVGSVIQEITVCGSICSCEPPSQIS